MLQNIAGTAHCPSTYLLKFQENKSIFINSGRYDFGLHTG